MNCSTHKVKILYNIKLWNEFQQNNDITNYTTNNDNLEKVFKVFNYF